MQYHYLNNGGEIIGPAATVISHMHRHSYAPSTSDALWMQDVARRALRVPGVVIRTDTPDNFLTDMASHGLVKLAIIAE